MVTLMLERLANCDNNDAPALILDLLPARLNNLLKTLDDGQLVRVVCALQLLCQRHKHGILPCAILPIFITTPVTSATCLLAPAL